MAGKSFVVFFMLVAGSLLVFAEQVQGACKLKTFDFAGVTSKDSIAFVGDISKFGGGLVGQDRVTNLEGTKEIGTFYGRCDALKTPGTFFCISSFHFDGKGSLEIMGKYAEGQTTTVSVIGGSGDFFGARGIASAAMSANGLSGVHKASFTTAEACADLLSGTEVVDMGHITS